MPELIRLAPAAQERGVEVIVIGCFSDPGLEPLREMLPIESGRRSLLTLTLRRPPKASSQPKPIG